MSKTTSTAIETTEAEVATPLAASFQAGVESARKDRRGRDRNLGGLLAHLGAAIAEVAEETAERIVAERDARLRAYVAVLVKDGGCDDEKIAKLVAARFNALDINEVVRREIARQLAAGRRSRLISLLWVLIGALIGALIGVGLAIWLLVSINGTPVPVGSTGWYTGVSQIVDGWQFEVFVVSLIGVAFATLGGLLGGLLSWIRR